MGVTVLDSMYNYYERMVVESLALQLDGRETEHDRVCDMTCIALNSLPSRYIRHSVDMAFFLKPEELVAMRKAVDEAVSSAIRKVGSD